MRTENDEHSFTVYMEDDVVGRFFWSFSHTLSL